GPAPAKRTKAGEPAKMGMANSEPVKTIVAALNDTPVITNDRADDDKKPENIIEERVVPGAVVASAVELPILRKDQSSLQESRLEVISPALQDVSPPVQDQSPAGDHGPIANQSPRDARDYREQAISAYRNGDLRLALSKLDLAIALDPNSSEA